jgi:outer membrane protein/protease secretion system outer membrane protein
MRHRTLPVAAPLAAFAAFAMFVAMTSAQAQTHEEAQAPALPPVAVERVAAPVLTLQAAWHAALANDPVLRAARAAAQAGQELAPQARALLLPQLSLSMSAAHNRLVSTTDDAAGSSRDGSQRYRSNQVALSLRQPLLAVAQHASLRQAHAQSTEIDAALAQVRQELAGRLAQAYFELLLADDQIALVQVQTTANAAQLDAARKRLLAGAGVRTDIDEAQARLDLDAAHALEAGQQRAQSWRRLRQLVGENFSDIRPLDVERLRQRPPVPGTLDDWITLAEQHSPELQVLRARSDAARAEVDKVRARHLPTLDALAQYSRGLSNDINRVNARTQSASVGLQLNVPLFSGGGIDSAVRQAQAELTRSEEGLAAQRQDLHLRLHREHRGVSEGLLRVKALEQAVVSSEQAVLSSRRSYQAGVRTTLDVLQAEQQLAVARRDLSQSRYDVLLSLVRLRSLAGAFDEASAGQLDGWLATAPH